MLQPWKKPRKIKVSDVLYSQTLFEGLLDNSNIKPMSHGNGIDIWSDMLILFKTLYQDTGFLSFDAILIWLSSQTASDWSNVTLFAESQKRDCKCLKEIATKNVHDWMSIKLLLYGLDSEYWSFRMMLNNNCKAELIKKILTETRSDFILEQILNLDTQRKISVARSIKISSKLKNEKKDL